jgi:hypothetical protein
MSKPITLGIPTRREAKQARSTSFVFDILKPQLRFYATRLAAESILAEPSAILFRFSPEAGAGNARQRDARVGEIGLRIGYESEAASSRAYKEFFGHSPRVEFALQEGVGT